jgi:hypothetical protein
MAVTYPTVPTKKELTMNIVRPPAMEAARWSSPILERNTRSTNIMSESEAWDTTMGRAIERRRVSVVLLVVIMGRSKLY